MVLRFGDVLGFRLGFDALEIVQPLQTLLAALHLDHVLDRDHAAAEHMAAFLGKFLVLELHARRRTGSAIRALLGMAPKTARRVRLTRSVMRRAVG